MLINENTIIGDILNLDKSCAEIFIAHGMHCLGCPASRGETLREACDVHEIDCAELIKNLKARISSN